jgi:hypothetical protein
MPDYGVPVFNWPLMHPFWAWFLNALLAACLGDSYILTGR